MSALSATTEIKPVTRVVASRARSISRKKLSEVQEKSYFLKMSANGQITIPKELRGKLGWKPGDTVIFILRKRGVEVRKQESLREEMTKWRQGLSAESNDLIQKTAGWTVNQYHEYFDNLPENMEEMRRKYGLK